MIGPKIYESSIEGCIYADCPTCTNTMRLGELWVDLILNEDEDVPNCPDCEPDSWTEESDPIADGHELWACMGEELDPEDDHQDRAITDGGSITDDRERPDPAEDPNLCSLCGVYIGFGGDEYCDGCARDVGVKSPLRRCMGCGRRAPEDHMEAVDVSPPDEYYPNFEYICQSCSSDGDDLRTDGGTDVGGDDHYDHEIDVETAHELQDLECPGCGEAFKELLRDHKIGGSTCPHCNDWIRYRFKDEREQDSVQDATEQTTLTDGGVVQARDHRTIKNETQRLASIRYSIETQARVETLLWVLGYIKDDHCPSGAADDRRVRDLTNRGSWPFDPSLGRSLQQGSDCTEGEEPRGDDQ